MGGKTGNDNGQGGSYNPSQMGALFGTKLNDYVNKDVPVFGESMFAEPGADTLKGRGMLRSFAAGSQPGLNSAYSFTDNLIRGQGFMPGMGGDIAETDMIGNQYGGIADNLAGPSYTEQKLAGRQYGTTDPAYERLRSKLMDDVKTDFYKDANASGMFGGDQEMRAAAEGVTDAVGGMDLEQARYGDAMERGDISAIEGARGSTLAQRMAALTGRQGAATGAYGMRQGGINNALTAANSLGNRYADMLLPAETIRGVGSDVDAASQGRLAGRADLFDRTNNANWNRFAEALGLFSGANGSPGMTEKVPLWQQLLGYVGQNAGNVLGAYAR